MIFCTLYLSVDGIKFQLSSVITTFSGDFSFEEDKNLYYQDLGKQRCLKMLLKANEKSPENVVITEESWNLIPSTLKYKVQNIMLGADETNFQNG
jgi:hypothetical protein